MQTHGRPLEAQMETVRIFISCWLFWNQIYWKTKFRSYHRIHQKILPCVYWLDWWPVMWNQNILELWSSKKRWPLHAKACTQHPSWIPTPISQKTQTCTTQVVTTKLWNKTKLNKEESLLEILLENRKTEYRSGEKFSIFWMSSRPNVTSGTQINHSEVIKKEQHK